MSNNVFSICVLISGNGSNLQALIDYADQGQYRIASVISNRPDAYGLTRAKQANISAHTIDHRQYASREDFEHALIQQIQYDAIDLVVLAGFMRKLTPAFIQAFAPNIVNIHPSLLPKYPGLHTHQRALDAGDSEHGVSIHTVTEELDAGPILAQASCQIEPGDTAEQLQGKIHALEHRLYPQVIADIAQGRTPII